MNRRKRIATAVSLCAMLMTNNVFAKEINDWAFDSFTDLNTSGILNIDIISKKLTDNISRGEFCRLITNLYETEKSIVLGASDYGIFLDSNDEAVLKAYKLGVVNGKGNGRFLPDNSITRQEMGVMISRLLGKMSEDYSKYDFQIDKYNLLYKDSSQTDDWAIADMAAVTAHNIINGDENGFVNPKKNATREEAVCMTDRVWKGYAKTRTSYQIPAIISASDSKSGTHILSAEWTYTPNVDSYCVLVKQDGEKPVVLSVDSEKLSVENADTHMSAQRDMTVYVVAYMKNNKQVFSKPLTLDGETKTANISSSVPSFVYSYGYDESESVTMMNEKEQKAFPDGHYFETEEEARNNMAEVTVPVWKLNSDGSKTASQKTLTVNKNLVDDVWSIFTEIYNDPSQFPIKDVGGYSWRKTAGGSVSQHSYGTCIDINYNENYYVKPDGTPITGSYWKPGEDPYSIPEDSAVVEIFAKYGWKWGGNAWSDAYSKDYMHFTYLGK